MVEQKKKTASSNAFPIDATKNREKKTVGSCSKLPIIELCHLFYATRKFNHSNGLEFTERACLCVKKHVCLSVSNSEIVQ